MSGRKLCQKVIMKDDRPLKFHSRGFMLQEEKKGNKIKGKNSGKSYRMRSSHPWKDWPKPSF